MNGKIPTELGLLTLVNELSLYGMQMTGTIPTELGLLSSSITGLFLHENYLEGNIPSELGLLTNLESLWMHQLSLTGTVPAELCTLFDEGRLRTLAVDCLKVSCRCGCSCPTEGGDAPRTDPNLASTAEQLLTDRTMSMGTSEGDGAKTVAGGISGNIFRHQKGSPAA